MTRTDYTKPRSLLPLALLVAALVVPTANGAVRPDDQADRSFPGSASAALDTGLLSNDDKVAGAPRETGLLSNDDKVAPDASYYVAASVASPVATASSPSTGFAWGDASFGAAAGLAAALLLAVAALAVSRSVRSSVRIAQP